MRAASHRSRPCIRRRRCRALAPTRPTSIPRGWSASTGGRPPGTARRGGFYGITGHDYSDRDKAFGFQQVVYEAIQHVPVLREAWVFSFRARAATTIDKDDQQIPFFMMPYLGGSSSLRGYTSLRFRDRNSLLLQAEWRIMASRFLDSAVFYDAGKVAARPSDLNFDGMQHNFGFGRPFSRAHLYAPPGRVGQGERGAGARVRDIRRFLRCRPCPHHTSRHASCAQASGSSFSRPRSACSPPSSQPRPCAFTTTIRLPANRSRRTRRRRSRISFSSCTSRSTACSSSQAKSRRARAPGTSTRSTRCPTRAGSPTASAPPRSRPTRWCAGPMSARHPTRRNGS